MTTGRRRLSFSYTVRNSPSIITWEEWIIEISRVTVAKRIILPARAPIDISMSPIARGLITKLNRLSPVL
jgi:hypothetical protein